MPMSDLEVPVSGVALDVDGVLKNGSTLLPGARDTLAWLRTRSMPFVLASNTTSVDQATLGTNLAAAGLPVEIGDVVRFPRITADYIRATAPKARCFVVAEGRPFSPDDGLRCADEGVTHVVVGGAGDSVDYDRLNRAYSHLLGGAELIAMHRNMCWRTGDGLALDAGAFVVGLEAAAGVKAKVLGKPSPDFFRLALAQKRIAPSEAIMIGDDVVNDVLAAQTIGMTGVLVRTGKFFEVALARARGRPDFVVGSIADLPDLVERLAIRKPPVAGAQGRFA